MCIETKHQKRKPRHQTKTTGDVQHSPLTKLPPNKKPQVPLLRTPRLLHFHTAESFYAALIPPSVGPHLSRSISSKGETE